MQLAAEAGIAVLEAGLPELDRLTGGAIHQKLSRVVANACDMLVSIPMVSGNESLNAGIAASIALYEIAGVRARRH